MERYLLIFRMKNSCSNEHGKLCFGAPEIISGTPKQLAARLKAREGLHFKVVTPESRKRGTKKRENERCNVQICFQEMGTAKNMNAIYPCFQSIVNRIFSSFGIVSWDLFSATILPVHGVRCKFAGL